jgi:hypothetical protein
VPTSYRGDVAWEPDSQTGLYELTRDDGSAVRLHDTYLRSVAYEAGPPSSLVLVFEYDSGWIPDGRHRTPFVEFRFAGVEDFAREVANAADAQAEDVQAFDHYASDRFVLETTTLTLRFRATSVELLLR